LGKCLNNSINEVRGLLTKLKREGEGITFYHMKGEECKREPDIPSEPWSEKTRGKSRQPLKREKSRDNNRREAE